MARAGIVVLAAAAVLPAMAGAATPAQAPQLYRDDLEAWLDGYLPYALQRGDVAGAVVVVVKNGDVLLKKGYGYADVAKRAPVDADTTLFRVGSVAKLFTWTAVMQQVEHGKLDLDSDINRYLDFAIPARDGQPLTLRHLITHTPGFEEVFKNMTSSTPDEMLSLEAYVKAWTPRRIFPAGQVPAYSNYGVALAGYIVQRVAGESFEDYVERHILGPLGMEHSSFRQPLPAKLQPMMSQGYLRASQPPRPFELAAASPAGSLSATGADMARFMIAHLQKGTYGSTRILDAPTAELMHSTALTILPPLNRMVLGFYESNWNGLRVIGHGGDTSLFHTSLQIFPDEGVGLFISMNSTGVGDVSRAIRTSLFEGFTDRYFPAQRQDDEVEPATAAAHAKHIAGRYYFSRRAQSNLFSLLNLPAQARVIANVDGTISVSLLRGLNGQPKRWREVSPFVWRDVDGKDRIAARVDGNRVVMFSTDQASPFLVLQPVPVWKSAAWLLPALVFALMVLALALITWPVAAFVRRRYGSSLSLSRRDARVQLTARIAALAMLVSFLGFVVTVSSLRADLTLATPKLDPLIWTLQILAVPVFVGAPAISLWNSWLTWAGERAWTAKIGSLMVTAACCIVLWTALAFHLIGFGANY